MPRQRIAATSLPRRLDRRRVRDNATTAQRRPRRPPGQVEAIAERRVIALRLRRAGGSYREIAGQLAVDVATAHADVRAELAALREQTVEEAKELRDLELQRFDEMTAGLWPQVRAGSPMHVTAAVRVAERRAKLLGLDEPVASRTELSASLSMAADTRLNAMKEDFLQWLDIGELERLAAASDQPFTDAMALVQSRKNRMQLAASPSPTVVDTAIEVVRANDAEPGPAAAGDACGGAGESNSEIGDNAAVVDET